MGFRGWMRGAGCAALVVAAMGGGGVRSTVAHAAPTKGAAPVEGAALAQAFGARVAVSDMSMSPDGTHVAFIVPDGAGQQVMVADLVAGGTPRSVLASPRAGEKLFGCSWPTDKRLFCRIRIYEANVGTPISYARMVAIDSDGGHLTVVSQRQTDRALGFDYHGDAVIDWTGDKPGQVLMTHSFVPEMSTGTHLAQTQEGLGVVSVNVTNLQRRTVQMGRVDAAGYLTDGIGHVRIIAREVQNSTGYETGKLNWYYRKAGTGDWNLLGHTDDSNGSSVKGFVPLAVDPTLDVAYGFGTGEEGRTALYRIKLDGSLTRERVLGRSDVDVDDLVTIGRNRRVVGVSYATDKRVVEFFDPELAKLAAALHKALPGQPQISFVDASADESRLLLLASGDTDPGMYYVFDKKTRKLEQVLGLRPELEGVKLAPMQAISYRAADGTMIPAYLTLPPGHNPGDSSGKGLPAIVMPHGGPSARDEWGFDWMVQFYALRGYAVLQPNYRGSSGYGVDWQNGNAFHSWARAIADIDDAGRWLLAQGIAAPGKLGIVGWSYGGYAALQSGVVDPGLFKAIVAVAPVTDLPRLRDDQMAYTNGVIVGRQIGEGDSLKGASPALNAGAFTVPVLLFHGDQDLNVPVAQSREMADRLRPTGHLAAYVEFKGLDHQLESAQARTQILDDSDALLRKAMGLKP